MSKGFTLIELVISIFILSVAVVGIYSAFSVVVVLTADTADKLTATYLAQEGMEIVRNIRDTNWLNIDCCNNLNCNYCPSLNGASWTDGLTGDAINNGIDCSDSQPCKADFTYKYLQHTVDKDFLHIDANGFYSYSEAGTETKFERRIVITSLDDFGNNSPKHILMVKVEVSWNKKAIILNKFMSADTCVEGSNCIKTEGTLYDWYNYTIPNTPPPS